ncbi:MAG: hypothetical protein Fur0018_23500 [Anaerolineales bacterium]
MTDEKTDPQANNQRSADRREAPLDALAQQGLLDQITDGIVVFDAQMNYLYLNQRAGELLGRDPEDLRGKNYWDEYPEAAGSTFANAYQKAIKAQEFMRIEDYYAPFDRWFENRIYPTGDGILILFTETTEQKKAELALKAALRRNNLILETTLDGYLLINADGQIIDVNPAYCALSGYSREELLKMNLRDIQAELPPEEVPARLAKFIAAGRGRVRCQHRAKDGHLIDLDASVSLVPEADGPLLAIFVYDITAKLQHEKELKESEASLRALNTHLAAAQAELQDLYDQAPVAYLSVNSQGRIVKANRMAAHLTGHDRPADLLGKEVFDLYADTPHGRPRAGQIFRRFLSGETVQGEEMHMRRRDGQDLWVSLSVNRALDASGEPLSRSVFQDITRQRQAEEALRHSQERFSDAFELSPLLMSITRMSDDCFIETNQNFVDTLGYSREQVIGHTPAEINLWVNPADRERLRTELREKGRVIQMQTRVNTRRGEIRDILISSRPLVIDGDPCILIVGMDITERLAAEAALRESEQRYRLLVDFAPYGIAVHQDGRVVFVNPAGARLIGAESPEQVVGMSITEIIAPENLEAAKERIQRMLQGERGLYPTEDVYLRLDGSRILVEVIAAPFTFNERPAVQVIVQDITARQQAEQALKESEARYRQLFEDAADGLLVLDAENNILDLNERICQLLGYDREALRSINAVALLYPEDLAAKDHAAAYQALMRGETILSTYRLRKRDGTYLPTELSTKWLGGNRFLNIVRDISERLRSAAELEESRRRLRELARYLQTARENERKAIAREIHDDLGQRLTGLKIETVRLAGLLPEERLDLAARAARMSIFIDETIDRVRNLSSRLRPGLLDDLGLIPALEWLGEDFSARTGIACELRLPEGDPVIPPEIATDTYRICQEALTNVVRHARASRVLIGLAIEPDGLHLMVQDDGRGISTDGLQGSDSLGLLGMQERALQWNGTISFDGEPGQGTTVRLHIPLDVQP